MAEGSTGLDRTEIIRAFIEDIRRRYGARVIGQRPCTKLYTHYVADYTRLPEWGTIQRCSEHTHCSKYAPDTHEP